MAGCTSCTAKHGEDHPVHSRQVLMTEITGTCASQPCHMNKKSFGYLQYLIFSFSEDTLGKQLAVRLPKKNCLFGQNLEGISEEKGLKSERALACLATKIMREEPLRSMTDNISGKKQQQVSLTLKSLSVGLLVLLEFI